MDITILDKAKAEENHGQSLVGAIVNQLGNLVFTRGNGSTVNAGKVVSDPVAAWPIGSVYISMTAVNPAQTLKGGTWERFAQGRVLVGVDESQEPFIQPGTTHGEKETTLSIAQMPGHSHGSNTGGESQGHSHTGSAGGGGHEHTYQRHTGNLATASGGGANDLARNNLGSFGTTGGGAHTHNFTTNGNNVGHTHTILNEGGNQPQNNLQPGVNVYMWRRTA